MKDKKAREAISEMLKGERRKEVAKEVIKFAKERGLFFREIPKSISHPGRQID